MAEKHLKNTKKPREKHVEEEEIRKRERVRGERRLPPPFLLNNTYLNNKLINLYTFFFFFDITTQGKGEGRFVTSTSLGVIHSRLSYLLYSKLP
jgi:hypothetical protein